MVKVVLYAFALSMLCAGIWELVLSHQYANKSNNWKAVEGWMTDQGEDEFDFHLPGKKFRNINFFVAQPHAAFVYIVNDAMYFERQTLPPTLGLVHSSIMDSMVDGITSDTASIEEVMEEMRLVDTRPLARYNKETHKLEVRTEDGMTIATNYATNHLGEKWEELPRDQWDRFMPRIKIKYNPSNPQESVTDPDLLGGAETLKWTGIWCLIGAVLTVAAIKFHEWVTKPAPEQDVDLLKSGPRRRL